MRCLIVGEDTNLLEEMEWSLREVTGQEAHIFRAESSKDALELAKENIIDLAFVDTDSEGIDGEKLAAKLRESNQDIYLVFTACDIYNFDKWESKADKAVVKPLDQDDVRKIIKNVKGQMNVSEAPTRLSVSNAGDFEIRCNGRPVHFARKKSKEMVAYLAKQKGLYISAEEIGAILWKNNDDAKERSAYVRVLASDIRKGFGMENITDVLVHSTKGYSLNLSKVTCD